MRAVRGTGLVLLHAPILTLPFTGMGRSGWLAFAIGYVVVMFAVGAALHRGFAHHGFGAPAPVRVVLALLCGAIFADPIGFAGRHRLHHRWSDTERDFHGPRHGRWFAWIGHLLEDGYPEATLTAETRDLARHRELAWIHRHPLACGLAAMALTLALGGWRIFAAGYCLPWCLVAIHGSSAVNYFCHRTGARRYDTPDRSTNHPLLAVLLLGEGWHNNHHHYPAAARAGFFWWECDVLYYALRALAALHLVRDVREVPDRVRRTGRLART